MVSAECKFEITNPERSQIERSEEVKAIEKRLEEEKESAELWMEYGLALSGQFLFREAVEAYSKAITLEPFCGILYRHRGHRHISCREYEQAAADFSVASRLIPDNWDVWYHYGLSHFLMGEYEKAEKIYKRCYEFNSDVTQLTACTDWYWRTLMRLGKKDEAAKLLEAIDPEMDPDADPTGYSRTTLIYKGIISIDDQMKELTDNSKLSTPTIAYAISNYCNMMGEHKKAKEVRKFLFDFCEDSWWSAFGYLAGLNDERDEQAQAK